MIILRKDYKMEESKIAIEMSKADDEHSALCLCEDVCREFVRKVECGEARSKRSYAQMKEALLKLDEARN